MEDEVAFQTFIKEQFENNNIIFNDGLGDVIERAMAKEMQSKELKFQRNQNF